MRREHFLEVELPEGYKQLEYIQSTGSQYINTNVYACENMHTFVDMTLDNSSGKPYMLASTGNGIRGYMLGFETPYLAYGFGNIAFVNTNHEFTVDTRNTYETMFSNGSQFMKVDNEIIKESSFSGTFSCTNPLSLFALNSGNSVYQYTSCHLYWCLIEKRSELVRNFIPALRLSDNKPGLYDLCGSICPLTNTPFYVNAGSGEFLYQ